MGIPIQGPGGATSNTMYANRRMAPYPSPAMHMSQRRAGQNYSSGPCPTMGNPGMAPGKFKFIVKTS